MLQTVAAAKLLDLAGISKPAASSTEARVKTVLCSSDNAQSISSLLSLSECVLCECVSSRPWTWARGMCWEPGKTMGCHGNRLRLGKHTGAKHTVVCVGENVGGRGGWKAENGSMNWWAFISPIHQSFNQHVVTWKCTCWMCKCFPPILDLHHSSIIHPSMPQIFCSTLAPYSHGFLST